MAADDLVGQAGQLRAQARRPTAAGSAVQGRSVEQSGICGQATRYCA